MSSPAEDPRQSSTDGGTSGLEPEGHEELDESNARAILVQHVPLESSAAAATR